MTARAIEHMARPLRPRSRRRAQHRERAQALRRVRRSTSCSPISISVARRIRLLRHVQRAGARRAGRDDHRLRHHGLRDGGDPGRRLRLPRQADRRSIRWARCCQRAIEKRRAAATETEAPAPPSDDRLDSTSPAARRRCSTCSRPWRASRPDATSVLILGESGTGKELVARALHRRSPRGGRRFVPRQLRGDPRGPARERAVRPRARRVHRRASATRAGLFEEAHRRHAVPRRDRRPVAAAAGQAAARAPGAARCSRSAATRRSRSTSASSPRPTATSSELRRAPDASARTSTTGSTSSRSQLPPLRERARGHPAPGRALPRASTARTCGQPPTRLRARRRERLLLAYRWPGNVRELENVVERAVVLVDATAEIAPDSPAAASPDAGAAARRDRRLVPPRAMIERYVQQVLDYTGGNHTRAASILGISRRTLHRMAARKRRADAGSGDRHRRPPRNPDAARLSTSLHRHLWMV